ncbi:nucleotide sugar dehydrogenase [Candidatus Bathyarchaeota archaeon]|nr:nucleotide sugar dehydrogenase [Candidatus Bathyarchaeota archaeon]
MAAFLHLKTEEIDTKEKREKYTVCVIGCEEKGILYAVSFVEAGFKVVCTDADQTLVEHLSKGKTVFSDREIETRLKSFLRRGRLSVTSELHNAVSQSGIVIMTLTAKLDGKKQPDYSEVESACKQVGKALSRGMLFIYGGIAGVGFTEGVVKETLENTSGLRVGEDFGLVYSPIRFFSGQPLDSIAKQELKVAALDEASLDSAAKVLEVITGKAVKQIPDVKTAEAALLFTIAKQDANLALANELAVFCENAGIDCFETLKLVDVDGESFSPTVEAEEVNRNEAYLLLESAENLNAKLRLPALARKINEDLVRHAINLTKDALRSCGKTVRRARVAVFGTAKPKTATTMFVKMLERRGAKASVYDPLVSKNEFSDVARVLKKSMKEAVEGADCIVVLTGQDQFKRLNFKRLQAVMKIPAAIVDLTGMYEPKKVERKGFTYRGLGRGVEKK